MLCCSLKGPTIEQTALLLEKVQEKVDLVELRLDYFPRKEREKLALLRSSFSVPMIFTLRSGRQGGGYHQSEKKRCHEIRTLLKLHPEYLDLEYDTHPSFIEEVRRDYPTTKLIFSYHNFEKTPDDLHAILHEMQKTPATFYKIATYAHSTLDALRLLCLLKGAEKNLIAISMGIHGEVGRIIGPVLGAPITYASIGEESKTAPGQLEVDTLLERYHSQSLSSKTALYGLIGDPVSQSISDVTHNHFLRAKGRDALYVKMRVLPEELSEFLRLAKKLSFRGLSVTMPLKEKILSHLDHVSLDAEAIGAVNTILLEEGLWKGFNTDGIGAYQALGCSVQGKRIVILGAGGAARAIAYHLIQEGGCVTLLNRDEKRACCVAKELCCSGDSLNHMRDQAENGYDILINCTSSDLPISPDYILPNRCVMDIKTRPRETLFLKHARSKGCRIVYGEEMFYRQAIGQFRLWLREATSGSTV